MAQASPETPRHLRAGAALLPPRAVDSSSQFERLRSLGSAGSATGPASAPSRQASVYVVRRPPRPPGRASGTAASLQDAGCGASHSPPCVSENHGLPGRRRSAVSFSGDRTPCPHHPPGSQTLNQRGAAPFVSAGRRRGAAGEGPRRQELGACRAPRRLSPCSELRVSKGFSRLQVATQPRRTRAVQEICQQPPPGHRASPQPERSPRRAGGRQAAPGSVTASLRAPRRVGPALEAHLSRGLSWGRGGHEEAPGGPCGRSLGRKPRWSLWAESPQEAAGGPWGRSLGRSLVTHLVTSHRKSAPRPPSGPPQGPCTSRTREQGANATSTTPAA